MLVCSNSSDTSSPLILIISNSLVKDITLAQYPSYESQVIFVMWFGPQRIKLTEGQCSGYYIGGFSGIFYIEIIKFYVR